MDKKNNINSDTNYGNWVPSVMMQVSWTVTIILMLLTFVEAVTLKITVLTIILSVLLLTLILLTIYMQICRNKFDFNKGGLMGEIHEYLAEHLLWDGCGKLLDIGCGAGALTIRCAKKFPCAYLIGMDFWGREWSYAKEQCERNAEIEKVDKRILFEQGDAARLKYKDGEFDAAVSNFVFHEVKTQPKKRLVVKEALRVIKKGGAFAFQDLFGQPAVYGDMNEFIQELKKDGISEIHYISDIEKQDFIPSYLSTPWMLNDVSFIYVIK